MRHVVAVLLVLAMLAGMLACALAQEKPLPRRQSGELSSESAIARAFQRVRPLGFVEASVFACPPSTDDDGYAIVFLHSDGDVSIFQGGSDPSKDQVLTFEKNRLQALEDTIHRMRNK